MYCLIGNHDDSLVGLSPNPSLKWRMSRYHAIQINLIIRRRNGAYIDSVLLRNAPRGCNHECGFEDSKTGGLSMQDVLLEKPLSNT